MLDTHRSILSIALGVQAARRGHRVSFATAQQWVGRLGEAKRKGRLDEELERLATMAPDWRMPCSCGSGLCRRTVTGDDWRRPELQNLYAGHFAYPIERRIATEGLRRAPAISLCIGTDALLPGGSSRTACRPEELLRVSVKAQSCAPRWQSPCWLGVVG